MNKTNIGLRTIGNDPRFLNSTISESVIWIKDTITEEVSQPEPDDHINPLQT